MPTVTLPIQAGLLSDLAPEDIFKLGGLQTASNVIPVNNQYLPVLDLFTFNSTAISGTPSQGITVQCPNDFVFYNFVGSSTHLYRFTSSAMTNKSGATYTSPNWQFEQYGNWLIATNELDVPQILKGIDGAGSFAALGGTPPKAAYCLMFNGYLILAHLGDDADLGDDAKGIRWSSLENPEEWTSAPATTGGDFQSFPDTIGAITGIKRIGDVFAIFSERSITIGYPSAGYIFEFKTNYHTNIGCFYPNSLISIGPACYFWGQDSIYMIDVSLQIKDIARGKIKRTLFQDINMSLDNNICICHDKTNSLIIWSYASTGCVSGFDRMLCYNYDTDSFTRITGVSGVALFLGSTAGLSIDELTDMSIDDIVSSIDSNYWLNKSLQPMIVNASKKVCTLTGSALEVNLLTGEFQDLPKVVTVTKAYAPIERLTGSASITAQGRYSSLDAYSVNSANSFKSDGTADMRYSNKRLAFNIKGSGFSAITSQLRVDIIERGTR